MNDKDQAKILAQKNKKTVSIVLTMVCAMIGLSFASVPLYNVFCRVTGFGGTTQTSAVFPSDDDVLDRKITVRFDGNTAPDMPWDFKPENISTTLQIGARGFANFIAENKSDETITGMAVFNVTPLKAGIYFHKVQCFCFGEQTLKPHERVNMPVLFYVDPALDTDRAMEDVKVITLSYSFFKTDSEALDQAVDKFYNE
tara:strand:+ start:524 stop:1120 length:597 start_codon:yes stop_codon:yes gene_type:complete